MAESTAKKGAPAGAAEAKSRPIVHTPADQVHVVAAILATAGGAQTAANENPAKASAALVQRYRQLVRILSRGEGEEGED